MRSKYLIRLDDACPTMSVEKWTRIEAILDNYNIRPMVGVVPHNEDEHLMCDEEDNDFWIKVKEWEAKGWSIALHGYNHCYISEAGMSGLNPFWKRSEFAGVSIEKQKEKIRMGVSILKEKGVNPKYFFAPSHTFDENTIEALRTESEIRIISDTIGRKPYKRKDFVYIPQIVGHCTELPVSGIWTFCLHPNAMTEANFEATEQFIKQHKNEFIGFDDIDFSDTKRKALLDKLMSWMFFAYRRIRGLK